MFFYSTWSPGIGDPTFLGWMTVATYLLRAVLCFWAGTLRRPIVYRNRALDQNPKLFWFLLVVLMLALGINKQLDLQSLVIKLAREFTYQQGWYGRRGWIYIMVIIGLISAGSVTFLFSLRLLWHATFAVKLALGGCVLLFGFVLLRISAFHHMHRIFGIPLHRDRLNGMIELGSILVIIIAAVITILVSRREPENLIGDHKT